MDGDLVGRARQGDRAAFTALVAENYDFIHAVAWRWTGSGSDADDIAQEVCLRLASGIRSFRGDGPVRTWLYAVTLNAVRDHGRKMSRDRQKAAAYLADPSRGTDGSEGERLENLWAAVRQLPPRQCDAVMLVYAEGLSHQQAAVIIGCSENTISWHLHEARKRLRVEMGEDQA
nr:sigma-70 family RNA polymerase sigma factor [uncultured Gellertiella sp.]